MIASFDLRTYKKICCVRLCSFALDIDPPPPPTPPRELVDLTKKLDPTRPVTFACNQKYNTDKAVSIPPPSPSLFPSSSPLPSPSLSPSPLPPPSPPRSPCHCSTYVLLRGVRFSSPIDSVHGRDLYQSLLWLVLQRWTLGDHQALFCYWAGHLVWDTQEANDYHRVRCRNHCWHTHGKFSTVVMASVSILVH